jgi:hypothetical protein
MDISEILDLWANYCDVSAWDAGFRSTLSGGWTNAPMAVSNDQD